MNRLLKVLLSLNSLRKAIGINSFFAATKFDHHLQISPDLNFQKILVLAPHPDDEVFGAGGLLVKLAQKQREITVAYFCDGSGGIPEKNYQALSQRNEKEELGQRIDHDLNLIEIRKSEAKKSAAILGLKEQIFFGYRDGRLAAGQAAFKALNDLIERVKPDIILTPSFLDNHPDHRAVNEVLVNSDIDNKDFEIWAYEVWTPIFVNRIVDISAVIEKKKTAIDAHASQLKSRRYDRAIIGLNQYRAELNGLTGFAEGFFATTFEIYQKLYQKS